MKSTASAGILAALILCLAGFALPLQAAAPAVETLIDFTDNRRDYDGTVYHAYEYVWDTWNKHVFDLPRRGVLIKGPTSRGTLGENKTLVDFEECIAATLHYVIGEGNAATRLAFVLEDTDGTVQSWNIPLAGQPAGREIRHHFDIAKPDSQDKPGKKPGLNLKKISTWQLKGDWSDAKVEVLLLKLTGQK